ncbi:hypothetical protein K435DRAFT_790173 [Dendrothele bispora CBS 962.96]|uniref:Glycerophosphocholine acyltransferase 1 n=1 Tax=Dendrothele bispora (strain CBS 962.96) TaxID=1314807 RepID=A0A4S8MQK9_DENBC|nr:hypothetical protein K435DRAFT_790173 [Dendrothele bispora CBS 962.96]
MPSKRSPPNGRGAATTKSKSDTALVSPKKTTTKTSATTGKKSLRRDEFIDWSSGFTLLDTLETYFDSHVDLLQRELKKRGDELRKRGDKLMMKADKTLENLKFRDLSGDLLTTSTENFEREFKGFKIKVSARLTKLSSSWQSAKVVRTREKVSFFFGVMALLFTALIFSLYPQYIHIAYTLLASYLLPLRTYIYKKRAWHYFLFDLCYYVTILNFVYLWVFPGSPALFVACYCLSHGSLASAVITWRNSLVFHDLDKVTSLFIHIYPPLVFTVIRHFYPNAEERFPALKELPHLNPWNALLISGGIYFSWQLFYWKFVLIDRREKIESGQRTTSFSFLLNNQRGLIGRMLCSVPPQSRIAAFMMGQLVYMVLTELPAVYVLYDSGKWSGVFLVSIFAVSVWNGGGYYIEVFGRKFERELEALRKELAELTEKEKEREKELKITMGTAGESSTSTTTVSSPSSSLGLSLGGLSSSDEDEDSSVDNSPALVSKGLPDVTLGNVGLSSAGTMSEPSGLGIEMRMDEDDDDDDDDDEEEEEEGKKDR